GYDIFRVIRRVRHHDYHRIASEPLQPIANGATKPMCASIALQPYARIDRDAHLDLSTRRVAASVVDYQDLIVDPLALQLAPNLIHSLADISCLVACGDDNRELHPWASFRTDAVWLSSRKIWSSVYSRRQIG